MLHFSSIMAFMKRSPLSLLSFAFGLLLALASARAQTFTITFDPGDPIGGLPVNSILSTQYAASTGATFTPNGFSGAGGPTGSWGTNTGMRVVSSTGADVGGLGTPSLVSGNILRSFNDWLSENGDPSFRITFANAIDSFSAVFAGIATPASTRIFGFNGSTLIATAVATTTTGQQMLSISSGLTFTSVVITPGDFLDWVGVDNMSFHIASTSAVPESGATLALLAGGVLLLIAMRRFATA